MGRLSVFLVSLGFISSAWAATLTINCVPIDYPTQSYPQLYLNIDFPESSDNCDPDYESDCGQIIGNYVLTADLSSPLKKYLDRRSVPTLIDQFDAPNSNSLEVGSAQLTFSLASGWRQKISSASRVPVNIESYLVSEGYGKFQLYCKKL